MNSFKEPRRKNYIFANIFRKLWISVDTKKQPCSFIFALLEHFNMARILYN